MEDIENKDDVAHFVQSFYSRVQKDDLIGPVFNQKIEQDNWPKHIEKLTGFWNTVLFGKQDYRGNPFAHHIDLNIGKPHFDRWIKLFTANVQENFEGPKASEAMMRAEKMRMMFESKLNYIQKNSDSHPIL